MFSLVNFSSIFSGGGGSADPICPYVRTQMNMKRSAVGVDHRRHVVSDCVHIANISPVSTLPQPVAQNACTDERMHFLACDYCRRRFSTGIMQLVYVPFA